MRQAKREPKDPFWEEHRKAILRIGEGEQRIRWLIDVAQTDLSSLSMGSLLNLRFELLVFSGQAVGAVTLRPETLRPEEALQDLNPFQAEIRQMLEAILGGQLLAVGLDHLGLRLMPASKDLRSPWQKESSSSNPNTNRIYRLFELLSDYAHQIRRCPRCKKYFLADRKNQDFCSRRCQTQAATYNYRLRKGEITGRPPGRPKKAEATARKKPVRKKRRRT